MSSAQEICVCGEGRVAHELRNGYCPLLLDKRWRLGCPECRGRGQIQRFEHGGDSSKNTGWAQYSLQRCQSCNGTGEASRVAA